MIVSLAAILLCQLAGEALARGFNLPAPGPVIGMALMIGVLACANALLPFFPPRSTTAASSASRREFSRICRCCSCRRASASCRTSICSRVTVFALALALVVSTFLALVVTVAVFRLTSRLMGEDAGKPAPGSPS